MPPVRPARSPSICVTARVLYASERLIVSLRPALSAEEAECVVQRRVNGMINATAAEQRSHNSLSEAIAIANRRIHSLANVFVAPPAAAAGAAITS